MSDLNTFTVAELIEKLRAMPQDARVAMVGCCGGACGHWSGEVALYERDPVTTFDRACVVLQRED